MLNTIYNDVVLTLVIAPLEVLAGLILMYMYLHRENKSKPTEYVQAVPKAKVPEINYVDENSEPVYYNDIEQDWYYVETNEKVYDRD